MKLAEKGDKKKKKHGNRLTILSTELKKLRLERDETIKKAEGVDVRVRTSEGKIVEFEDEIQTLKEKNADLEEQLRKVGVKIDEHKSLVKGCEEIAYQKAKKTRQLQEEIRETEPRVAKRPRLKLAPRAVPIEPPPLLYVEQLSN